MRLTFLVAFVVAALGCPAVRAEDNLPEPKPVPALQVLPLPDNQISIQNDGRELTRYYFDENQKRPFLYPIIGPSGRSLTRMGHPRDPQGHSHHNSIWISHHDVGGSDFWGDRGDGRIVQRRIDRLIDEGGPAVIETYNQWLRRDDKPLLNEHRRIEVAALTAREWLLTIDLLLEPATEEITLGKTPFGMIGVRMAKTIGVHDGGGRIRNSEGGENEAGVFWKHARWVDYSGPIAVGATEGVTLLDHPSNPNFPTVFHVRDDGWMGASLTHEESRNVNKSEPLRLRYGLYVHAGMPEAEQIEQQWKRFAESESEAFKTAGK